MESSTDLDASTTAIPFNSTSPTEGLVETWKVVVPIVIILSVMVITVIATSVALAFYKSYKRSTVFPVTEMTLNGDRLKLETSQNKTVDLEATLVSISENDDDLEVTRTKSLTVLIPRGRTLKDMFGTSAETDIGEFREPEELDGKLRWQIIQLEPVSDEKSETSFSERSQEDEVTDVVYRQGVYMGWESTLSELRDAFIETNQLDAEDLSFCFLHSDMLGDRIDIEVENTLCLNRLGSNVIESRTLYIETIDHGSVQRNLCVCGKHAQFVCSHCSSRGYCSTDCESDDYPNHILNCSTNRLIHGYQNDRRIDVIYEDGTPT